MQWDGLFADFGLSALDSLLPDVQPVGPAGGPTWHGGPTRGAPAVSQAPLMAPDRAASARRQPAVRGTRASSRPQAVPPPPPQLSFPPPRRVCWLQIRLFLSLSRMIFHGTVQRVGRAGSERRGCLPPNDLVFVLIHARRGKSQGGGGPGRRRGCWSATAAQKEARSVTSAPVGGCTWGTMT